VARSLAALAGPLGFDARWGARAEAGDFACVVASLGHGDEDAVRRGLEAGCEYVGLVASEVRGAAVLSELRDAGVSDDLLARVRTPAGLAIGAKTHEEIALSILAEIVQVRRTLTVPSAGGTVAAAGTATDPVCGMSVVVGPDTPTSPDGHAFCCEGCRDAWLARAP
jgi:xanthine dehydrogenase accessory factor